MRTGTMLLLTVFLFSLTASTSYAQRSDSGAQNITSVINTARFILFGGSYVLIGEQKAGDNRESAVFKLDTYTGKTWMLKVEKSVNGRVAYWVLVDEPANISADGKDEQKKDNGLKNTAKVLKTLDE
ncbi:MAG: hypothetical protein WC637_02535 [Victivallales bacterium]|jgi:hypothetical protein